MKSFSFDVLKGIYPGLKRVLDEQFAAVNTHSGEDVDESVELVERPDSHDPKSSGEYA